MAALPITDWHASLTAMEVALATTLASLDRYQARWESQLAGQGTRADADGALLVLDRLEDRLREWGNRLTAAAELATSVERELNDRETAVWRWQESFTGWRDVIQRGVGTST